MRPIVRLLAFGVCLSVGLLGAADPPVIVTVQSATDFGQGITFSSGGWLEIKGSNLSATTREWAASDFNGTFAPTQLDGVQVRINGRNAFVRYISPAQINVQAPEDPATGPVSVVVQTADGQTATSNFVKEGIAPGVLAPASFTVGGKQYAVATNKDGNFVCTGGFIPGVTCQTAKPGDIITFYGIGFGPAPPAIAGMIAQGLNRLNSGIAVRFGSAVCDITYAGLAPNLVGLYQLNVVVPQVAAGDYALIVVVGGAPVGQTMYVAVGS